MIVAEVVVQIERCYRKHFLDLYPLYEHGLETIMDTFSEVTEIGLLGQELARDTFFWPDDEGNMRDHYQEEIMGISTGQETEENFIRRTYFANRRVMAREFDQWDKIELTTDLMDLAKSLNVKFEQFRAVGVKFEMFKADYILEAVNKLWGADLTHIHRLYIHDENMEQDDLKRNLLHFHESLQAATE